MICMMLSRTGSDSERVLSVLSPDVPQGKSEGKSPNVLRIEVVDAEKVTDVLSVLAEHEGQRGVLDLTKFEAVPAAHGYHEHYDGYTLADAARTTTIIRTTLAKLAVMLGG